MADETRDRRVLRHGLAAGALLAGALSAILLLGLAPAGGAAAMAGLLLGLAAGALLSALWLLLALARDLLTGRPCGRRRMVVTAAVTAVAVLSPLIALAAAGTAGG
jgi:hypothetical protein